MSHLKKRAGRKHLYRHSKRTTILCESHVLAELKKRAGAAGLGTGEYLNRYLAKKWFITLDPRDILFTPAPKPKNEPESANGHVLPERQLPDSES